MKKQPQLNLEELLHFRWQLGGGLALLSIWTLFYLEAAIWPVAMLATGAILLCLLQPALPGRVPAWAWHLGVPVITVFFAIDLATHEMIPAFVRLNVLLVLHRAISYRTRREDLQLVVLCLFLIIVTGVLTVSLVFAVQIVLFTGLAMVFLFVVNVIHAATGDEPVPPATWALISRQRLLKRLWEVFDLRLVSLGTVLFLVAVSISTVIFLSIPRFQMENALGFFSLNRARSLTGFSEQIALGEVTHIAQDHGIAMRVDVLGGDAIPTVPYWRMVVLDAYERGVFRVSNAVTGKIGARTLPMLDFTPGTTAGSQAATAAGPRYVVFLEGGISRFLPLPGAFRSLHFKELQEISENPYFRTLATQKQHATLLSFMLEGVDFTGVIPDPGFSATVLPAPSIARDPAALADGFLRSHILNYPATTEMISVSGAAHRYLGSVVEEITGGRNLSASEFADRACEYLAQRHRYSLAVTLPPAEADDDPDPIIRWMRAGASGHCEFFAGAFTLLARKAGYPTRAVTGFKGGTWNAYENYYMVRNSDAHAWCEIYDAQGAWLRVDPTPGSGGVFTPAITGVPAIATVATDHSMRAYFDSLRMLWYRRIVNFDKRSQAQVAGSLRQSALSLGQWGRAMVGTLWEEFSGWRHRPWTFRESGDLLFFSIVLFLITMLMRRLGVGTSDLLTWLRKGEQPTRERAGDLLQRLRLRLAEPPRRRRFDPAVAREIEEQLSRIRYGRIDRWPAPLPVFRAARRML